MRRLVERMAKVTAMRERGEATVPTSIALERATNPFMRAVRSRNSQQGARPRTPPDRQ